MKYLKPFIILFIFANTFACKETQVDKSKFTEFGFRLEKDPQWETYMDLVKRTQTIKVHTASSYKNEEISSEKLRVFFIENLINYHMPFWYGTGWSADGRTRKPREGTTSASNFVAVVLKDFGFNYNVQKIAQRTPLQIVEAFSQGEQIFTAKMSTKEVLRHMKSQSDNVYLLGLDNNHYGFIVKAYDELFFIHASYLPPKEVLIERADESAVFDTATVYYMISLSGNEKLMDRWLFKKGEISL